MAIDKTTALEPAASVAVATVKTTVAVSWPLLLTAAVKVVVPEAVSATVGAEAPFKPGMTRVILSVWRSGATVVLKLKLKAPAQPVTAVP